MLPVVAGERNTKLQMMYYTALLVPITLMPVAFGMSGLIYGITATALGVGFAFHAWRVWRDSAPDGGNTARPMLFYTLIYLFLIFVGLLADRAFLIPVF